MAFYILATVEGPEDPKQYHEREEKYYPPIQADNPKEAMSKRGIVPEYYLKVYAYPVKTKPTGDCMVHKIKDE